MEQTYEQFEAETLKDASVIPVRGMKNGQRQMMMLEELAPEVRKEWVDRWWDQGRKPLRLKHD